MTSAPAIHPTLSPRHHRSGRAASPTGAGRPAHPSHHPLVTGEDTRDGHRTDQGRTRARYLGPDEDRLSRAGDPPRPCPPAGRAGPAPVPAPPAGAPEVRAGGPPP